MPDQRPASDGLHIVLFSGPSGGDTPRAVRAALAALPQSRVPAALVADLQLIATELLTNAVRAGADWVDCELIISEGELEIAVRDEAPGAPRRRHARPADVSGRGLGLVEAIADAWGFRVEQGAPGKTVWAIRRLH